MKTTKRFESIFLGELVEMITDFKDVPIISIGYLLDIDDQFFYLGKSAEEVSECVLKDKVTNIAIIHDKNEVVELLNNTPVVRLEDAN